ncbi:DUF2267 domain-containing protein [Cyanothece sp. BG0011]|uniref:DUF2267 domain-containing protein n=1 Tax=Cyanothece sp. BG0011 TaxID=2082950 RepID=UPI000D1DA53D|nr:DUF2267 domain-containing protein [Cyanothece sp. BG0011]
MPIKIREDVAYILLNKINQANQQGSERVDFNKTDFTGRNLTVSDFLGQLDYFNQKGYIDAEFTGNAYAKQEDVPSLVEAEDKGVDFRIANTLGAPDGPLPHLIRFKKASLTEKGHKALQRLQENYPQALEKGPKVPIATKDLPFLEKVQLKAELPDIFDARDLTIIVYRTLRDLMTTESSEKVKSEFKEDNKEELHELWKDNNPLVSWLSKIRPPLKFDGQTFLRRIEQEGGVPRGTDGVKVIKAVFSATKEELSDGMKQEIEAVLPDNIKNIWQAA